MALARNPLSILYSIAIVAFVISLMHLTLWHPASLSSFGNSSFITALKGEGNKAQKYCKWVFDRYESSAYEEQWFAEVPGVQSTTREGSNICQAMRTQQHITASREIVGRVINLTSINPEIRWTTYDTMPKASLRSADEYMSRMHYRRVCYNPEHNEFQAASGHGVQLIEPLFGMLRDPFDIYCGEATLVMDGYINNDPGQSKHHILPQGYAPYAYTLVDEGLPKEWRLGGMPPWHSSLRPVSHETMGTIFEPSQNIYLDLGSSYFNGWSKITGAASGEWFYNKYHNRGPKFDRFVAVEVEVLDDVKAFKAVPEDLIGIYTLMNLPLTMGKDKLNAVEMIKRLVKPEDFFVFKLDIDSAPIEDPIIRNLLADDPERGGASALIDELMFEHHVNYYPMNDQWSTHNEKADLSSSYHMFRDLRKKGIRAHSWP